jgi:hypothetical protein
MTRLEALRLQQDPTMAALRTDGARLLMAELRRTYAAADRAAANQRTALLRQAAVLTQAMRQAENMT